MKFDCLFNHINESFAIDVSSDYKKKAKKGGIQSYK